jgi:peptidoglycan L-alanyl-D-glutamate endopeptidase CwlK
MLLVASVVAAAVAGAWRLSEQHVLRGTVPERMDTGYAFRQLFNEERLVPPPPLPPAMFADTGLPSLAIADRNWWRVDPVLAQRILRVISRLEAQGFRFVLIEGYRSPDRQNALKNGAVKVTHASAYRSRHQFGLAVDLAPVLEGRIVMSEKDPRAREAYQALGREADAEGLVWGGHWSLRDFGHLEAEAPASVADQS